MASLMFHSWLYSRQGLYMRFATKKSVGSRLPDQQKYNSERLKPSSPIKRLDAK